MEKSEQQEASFYKNPSPVSQKGWIRYFFFFLTGMIAGMLLIKVLDIRRENQDIPVGQARGTVYSSSSFENMKPADVIYVDDPTLKTVIDVKYSTQLVEAHIEISTPYPVKLQIDFGFNDLSVLNVQNITVSDKSSTLASSNFIQIDNVGENRYIVRWLNKNRLSHQISFKFLQDDRVIYSNAVTVNKE